MAGSDSTLFDLGALDRLAQANTPVHRLDPRAKLLTTLIFILIVASFDKYSVAALFPFFLFPLALIVRARLPFRFMARKLLVVAPFAVCIGLFNPVFDHSVVLQLGSVAITGGWMSFLSILLRFTLSIGAALVLIATTSFPGVCMALAGLGAPRVFAVQLLLLYRYLFVLGSEAGRMNRARELRSCGVRGPGPAVFGTMVGQLLLRALDRAQRVHRAMLSRGFQGEIRLLRTSRFGRPEAAFILAWSSLFILLRLVDPPHRLGRWAMEWLR
jgi:cobalt/nickel transport system permease protein